MRPIEFVCILAFCFGVHLHLSLAQSVCGRVSGVVWTIAPSDRIPGAAEISVTVSFNLQTALVAADTITINFPSGFIAASATPNPIPANTFTASTPTATNIVLTVQSGLIPSGPYSVTLSGSSLGGATAGSSCGITVSTSMDLVSTGVASGAIGGVVSNVTWIIAPTDRIPFATGISVSVGFTLATALGSSGTITINYPSGFIAASAISFVTPDDTTASTPTATNIVLTVNKKSSIPIGPYTVTLLGVTLGPINAGNATGIAVSTEMDILSNGVPSGSLGGQVTGVSMTISAADRVPFATGKSVTVSFITATPLLKEQAVTITWPSFYISGQNIGVTYFEPFVFGTVSVTTTGAFMSVSIEIVSSELKANRYSITLTGVNMPGPMPAGCSKSVWVSTTTDLSSVDAVMTQAIGGQVTGVSMNIVASQRVPFSTAASISLSFTLQTALSSGNFLTLTYPSGYFTGSPATPVIASAGFAAAIGAMSATNVIMTTTTNVASGSYNVTISGGTLTLGGAIVGSATTGVTLYTTSDSAGTSGYPGLGGQITGVFVKIAAADRVPFATGRSVTVGFTTQTALANGQLVTISFPSSFISPPSGSNIGVSYAGPANTFATTAASVGSTALTVAVGSSGASFGFYTITLTGVTMASGPQFAGSGPLTCGGIGNFNVQTSTDMIGGANTPQIGGVVTGVTFIIAASDCVAGATGKSVTVSFTTQNALSGSSQFVTINFPSGYISAASGSSIGVSYAGPANTFAPTATSISSDALTIAVGSSGASPGAFTITLTGATMGSPIAANTQNGVLVSTSTDLAGITGYPSLGGVVTSATLQILPHDRIAAANRNLFLIFTTATTLVNGNTININFNQNNAQNGFIQAVTSEAVIGIAANAALASSGNSIVLTVTGSTVTAGVVMVTICGVTLGFFPVNNLYGVSVTTSQDFTTTCSPTGTVAAVNGQVTSVSMTIPWANRIAGNSVQATFSFTTQTMLPSSIANCYNLNSVNITFPSNFFVPVAQNSCGVTARLSATGLPGFTLVGIVDTSASTATFVFVGNTSLPAGAFVVVIGGLTLGSATAGSDTGVTVQTNMDAASAGSPSGPISGYKVIYATMQSCQVSTSCQSLIVTFMSNAGPIAPGGTLSITFTTVPVAGIPDAFMSGSALITGILTGNTLALKVNAFGGSWNIGNGPVIITLTGMTAASIGLQSTSQYVSVGGSTPAYSATYMPTGAGVTKTSSLIIDSAFIGVKNTQATISFTTTNVISNGDVIRTYLPAGFFVRAPQVMNCTGVTSSYKMIATGLGTCSALAVTDYKLLNDSTLIFDMIYSGTGLPSGNITIVLSGVTLPNTNVSSTNTFAVITTQNSCSSGFAATGYIQNCFPGQFWQSSILPCQACPVGSFSSTINSLACTPCPAGQFANKLGSSSCLPCLPGTYSSSAGTSDCSPCQPGHYCLMGASQPCSCHVNSFQPEASQDKCLPCPDQAQAKTGQTTCNTEYATTASDKIAYLWGFIVFLFVALLSLVLFLIMLFSRKSFSERPFHSAICVYVLMFLPYSVFKASAIWFLRRADTQSMQFVAQILLNASFSMYFVLGCGGKLALVQLWMHIIDRHANEDEVRFAGTKTKFLTCDGLIAP